MVLRVDRQQTNQVAASGCVPSTFESPFPAAAPTWPSVTWYCLRATSLGSRVALLLWVSQESCFSTAEEQGREGAELSSTMKAEIQGKEGGKSAGPELIKPPCPIREWIEKTNSHVFGLRKWTHLLIILSDMQYVGIIPYGLKKENGTHTLRSTSTLSPTAKCKF